MQLDSELLKSLQSHRETIADLKQQIDKIQKSIEEDSPFKVGDKVLCDQQVFFVYEVYSGTCYHYDLTSPRKDGSMPSKMTRARHYVSLSDLEPVVD